MKSLPTVICSSVIRSTQQGESHGGIYLVDLEKESVRQVVDWDDVSIDWSGRGSDRGLRGIDFYDSFIICAASDEIFFYDQQFRIVKSFRNDYLKHCHEICVHNDHLYLSSTGFDSILEFDLQSEQFTRGFLYRVQPPAGNKYLAALLRKIGVKNASITQGYDPNVPGGPIRKDSYHINNVFVHDGAIHFSGTGLDRLLKINWEQGAEVVSRIPYGTHNVMFCQETLLYNNTVDNSVTVRKQPSGETSAFEIIQYDAADLLHGDVPNDHARQGFGRGLCCTEDYIIGGSSPSTISVYSLAEMRTVKTVNITMDIRNAIHGLAVYPFPME